MKLKSKRESQSENILHSDHQVWQDKEEKSNGKHFQISPDAGSGPASGLHAPVVSLFVCGSGNVGSDSGFAEKYGSDRLRI